jgi:type IV pilus assembly protein PilF
MRVFLFGLALVTACGSGSASGPGAGDPDRMSDSEYDIARDSWLRQRQPRQALEHALKATELNEDNWEASHLVALLYLDFCGRSRDECRLDEAEKFARKALGTKPDFREARNTLGVILIHRKKYDDAVSVLKPLAEDMLYQTPENSWGNLGWAYLEQGKFDLAVQALERSVAAEPRFCVGNYRLGLAHERKGQPAQAIQSFTRALETEDPACRNLQDAFAARGRAQFQLGHTDEARSDFSRCAELNRETSSGKECETLLRKLK